MAHREAPRDPVALMGRIVLANIVTTPASTGELSHRA
jgi:hypothetical protein